MFLLIRPGDKAIQRFLDERANDDFSYAEVGESRLSAPAGYNIDHNRIRLGTGAADFQKAKAAISSWKMCEMPWVRLYPADTPIEIGRAVAVLVSHFGFYSLNASRIVYLIDEQSVVERYGFAYGTLTEHGEIGEERFTVEYDAESDEVWYDLFAFSRPGHALARLGYPISRYLQKAFAADSLRAMLRAV